MSPKQCRPWRWVTITAGLSLCSYSYGVITGAWHLPPYKLLVAAKTIAVNIVGGGNSAATTITPFLEQTDSHSLITISTAAEVDSRRKQLIETLWKDGSIPSNTTVTVTNDVADQTYAAISTLQRIDALTIEMDHGLRSICYHFVPRERNRRLVIYHQGHAGDFSLGKHVIAELLNAGHDVVGMSMPLKGMNNTPEVQLQRFGTLRLDDHKKLALLPRDRGHPVRFFIEPVVAVINLFAQSYSEIFMLGISGGGWTTLVSAAIDPRITRSYPVAGSLPIYIRAEDSRHWGDYEQTVPELYSVANYLELYVMAATGHDGKARRHIQVLNRNDSCCFFGDTYKLYEHAVATTVRMCGNGFFSVLLDSTHRSHAVSHYTIKKIVDDMGLTD